MELLKIIIGVSALVVFTRIGYIKAAQKEKEYAFYSSCAEFLRYYLSELKYLKNSLETLKDKEYSSEEFKNTLSSVIDGKTAVYPEYVKNNERVKFDSLFSLIGKGGEESQTTAVESFLCDFIKLSEEKREFNKKYKTLAIKTGFVLGLAILIMVI